MQAMNTSISRSMWTANPGYIVRDGTRMASHFKKEFTYDQEEVRSSGPVYCSQVHSKRAGEVQDGGGCKIMWNVIMPGEGV
jgi:hypothetical protein